MSGARRSKGGAEERRAWLREALLCALDGNAERAESALERIVQSDSTDVTAYRGLAQLFRERGEIGRAIRIHQNLLFSKKLSRAERAAITRGLADDFMAGGFAERARESYEAALKLESGDEGALDALVELAIDAGDVRGARKQMKRLARARREPAPALDAARYCELARIERERGADRSARRFFKWAAAADPANAELLEAQGDLEAECGNAKTATKAWQAALEVARGPETRRRLFAQLASAMASKRGGAKLRAALEGYLEKDPDDRAAREALGTALLAQGEREAGMDALREATLRAPADPETHAALGRALLAEGADEATLAAAYRRWVEALSPRIAEVAAEEAS